MRSMKHLLTLYCVRYQECISHYSVIAVIYICPDEQHGRKIMKLREKKGSTANEWFILSAELSSTSSYSFFPFHSSTYSFFFCSVLYLLVIIFFSPSMYCQLLSLCWFGQISPTLKKTTKTISTIKKGHDSLRVQSNSCSLQLKFLKEE